jgi:hypothetical protein
VTLGRKNNVDFSKNLRSSTAIVEGQLGHACCMQKRSPAVAPMAEMQIRLLPFSSGTTMYLARE